MRILQVVNVRWFNATAWYGLKLAKLLSQAGHEVKVVVLADTETAAKAKAWNLDCVWLPLNSKNPLNYPGLVWSMYLLLREFKPQLINCHRGEGYILWALLKKYAHYKLIRTRGDQRLPKSNWCNKLLYSSFSDAVVATNSRMAKHLQDELGVSPKRLFTILGGVGQEFKFDLEGRQRIRQKYGFSSQDFILGLLGRFDLVKGQKELLQVLANLKDKGYKCKLLLLGFATATSQAEVETWITNHKLEAEVTISGLVPDIVAHISALDLGIVASLDSEAIARAAVEILACNRPLISTRVGVMPDLLPAKALANQVEDLENLIEQALTSKIFLTEILEQSTILTDADFLKQTLLAYTAEIL